MHRYIVTGEFGQTEVAPNFSNIYKGTLDIIDSCGWHNVNDLHYGNRCEGESASFMLLFTISGEGIAHIYKKSFRLTPGTVLVVPPRAACGYQTKKAGQWEFYWLHICGDNAERMLGLLHGSVGMLITVKMERIVSWLRQIIESRYVHTEGGIFAAQMASKILFELLSYCVIHNEESGGKRRKMVAEIIEQIEEQYMHPLCLKQLSDKFFICEEHLIRQFKQETGTTPYRYYRRYKIERSAQMLCYSEKSIKEIATAVGYRNEASYSIQFRKEMELSPYAYRKKYQIYQN